MTTTKLTIRKWKPTDDNSLRKVFQETENDPRGLVRGPAEDLHEHYSFVATEHNDNAVGFASVMKRFPKDVFHLNTAMLKEHRGGNTAIQLMKAAIKSAQENGAEKIYAAAANTNLRIKLMERLGFEHLVSGELGALFVLNKK